jgi:4-diphosphocytidyl-2-C-methyl-D-erythritol kinase
LVKVKLKSFAKVNLHLDVLKKRDDGYHDIESIIQLVDLHDYMEFETLDEDKILFSTNSHSFNTLDNTVIKAIEVMRREFGSKSGLKIFLDKKIPIGSGLGGGSGNAAYTILTLNQIWDLKLDFQTMRTIGSRIGADVPVFLSGSLSHVTGKGEIVRELEPIKTDAVLIVYPNISISTGWAYQKIDDLLTKRMKFDKLGDSSEFTAVDFKELYNSFEEIALLSFPELKKIKELLDLKGAVFSRMSGSGSAIFGVFPDRNIASSTANEVASKFDYKTYLCNFLSFRSIDLSNEVFIVS